MRVLPLSSKQARKVHDVIIGILSSSEFQSWLAETKWLVAGDMALLMSNVSLKGTPLMSVNMCLKDWLRLSVGREALATTLSDLCTFESMIVRDNLPLFLTHGTASLAVSFVSPTIFVGTFFVSYEVGELL